MRVMVLVKATDDSEAEFAPAGASAEAMAAMDRFNDELDAAGIRVMAAGLKPSRVAKRVAFDGAGRTVTNGPFTPAEALVAGFWLWDVKRHERGAGLGEALPQPDAGAERHRNQAPLRGCRFRLTIRRCRSPPAPRRRPPFARAASMAC